MQQDEELFAFLDDVYMLSPPGRTRIAYDALAEVLTRKAGIQLHTGKTRVWNAAGVRPVNLEDLVPDVWNPRGIKILGTPVGSQEFIQEVCEERLQQERELWEAIPWVPDLQCAWQVLLQCAGPRCHHLLRTLAPESSQDYAVRHDGMFETMETLLHRSAVNCCTRSCGSTSMGSTICSCNRSTT